MTNGNARAAGEPDVDVLQLLRASRRALSGHAISRALAKSGRPMRASQVFRVLHRLLARSLIHRVEVASAFRAGPPNRAIYLSCSGCKALAREDAMRLAEDVAAIAAGRGFKPNRIVLEAVGKCARCRSRDRRQPDQRTDAPVI